MSYQGMRWFKCDLHMHTPEGPCWNDPALRLPDPRLDKTADNPEERIQEAARAYLRRCHEVELDAIAITDHNFSDRSNPRERFITHLIDQNETVAKDAGRLPLVIFPGFEIDIKYHLLCLFNPVRKSKDLQAISNALSELGLVEGRRLDGKVPKPLRSETAPVPLRTVLAKVQQEAGGIVIAAHAFSTDGICNDASHADDFRQNDDLLCVEVPALPLSDRASSILHHPEKTWRREHGEYAPAHITSSDAKSLKGGRDPDGKFIGSRYCWIKMSEPSIEALRQAFLDHDNRIRLQPESPEQDHPHGRIVSMSVGNTKFMADQSVFFSSELNCLIGGRGSGKSSLIEYLRILTRNDVKVSEDSEAGKQLKRISQTLTDDSVLRLEWDAGDGSERDVIEWKQSPPFRTESNFVSREVNEPETVFRNLGVAIYSQKEISELTDSDSARRLIELIDREIGAELSTSRNHEEQHRSTAKQLFLAQREQEGLERKQAVLEQELSELNRKWEARASMRDAAREHKLAQDAKRHLNSILKAPEAIQSELNALIENIPEHFPALPAAAKDWKHAEFFKRLDQAIDQSSTVLQEDIRIRFDRFNEQINTATRKDSAWKEMAAYLNAADEAFEAACREKGIAPDEVEELREIETQRRAKQAELESVKASLKRLRQQVANLPGTLNRLSEIWNGQTEIRQRFLDEIKDEMEPTEDDKHIVEFTLKSQADERDYIEKWRQLSPRGNTGLGQKWDAIGKSLLRLAVKDGRTPWDIVADMLDNPDAYDLGDLNERKQDFIKWMREDTEESQTRRTREKWEALRLERVDDDLDFTLRRKNGDVAGSLKGGALSDGQRNTVVLSLLMARGSGPIIIDQPEDELDSDFIYHELVPVVRRIKQRRQILFATHNANLPVNGDAEFVYALEAKGGHGVLRAAGGLDRENVKKAVLDIMEGSDTAFKRRREKYHF